MTMPTIAILGIDLGKKGSRIATKDHARGWSRSVPRCHLASLPWRYVVAPTSWGAPSSPTRKPLEARAALA